MDKSARIALTVAALSVAVQGCRILQTVSSGGSVLSASGQYDCAEDSTCEIDVQNGERFVETFTAVPRYGYAFAGWRGTESYLCAGIAPTCTVDIPGSITAYDATGYMTAAFYHQPELIYPGTLGREPGIWTTDVTYHSVGLPFADDFDGDGDDDVLITAATSLDPGFEVNREGVILINNGDWTFTVADGDRPSTTHARRILMADFNADGRNDFFIADHGRDADPFPGSDNQLLLWTSEGYLDASERLPDDSTGFTHSASVGDVDGDGDIDILVGNSFGGFMNGRPYLLLNDGEANFEFNQSRLPNGIVEFPWESTWAVGMDDLDADGHEDLVFGVHRPTGESLVYWGTQGGEYSEELMTVLPGPEFFPAIGGDYLAVSVTIADIDVDGRLDVLMGGYNGWPDWRRGLQILINSEDRTFTDETTRRLRTSAWSPTEQWHWRYRFLDFNGDGTLDLVPERYVTHLGNVLTWLNDGTGHYVALSSNMFPGAEALDWFGSGVKVRVGSQFKVMDFFGDGTMLGSNAGVVASSATITLAR